MYYKQLGDHGVRVSPICLGTMMFGGQTEESLAIEIMHKAIDEGINFFDTADMYNAGESEVLVGKALADRRDQVVLATKGRQKMGDGPNDYGSGRVHMLRAVEASLRRLNTDYIDIYYDHAPDYTTPIEETLRAMEDMVRSGKVRYIACSNFRAWRLAESLWVSDRCGLSRFSCVQPLYNIVNRDAEVELFPLCRQYGIGVVCYSPLARGVLTGKYLPGKEFPGGSRAARGDVRMKQAELREASFLVAQKLKEHCDGRKIALSQFALAWCLANPNLTSVIIGPRTMEQFDDNLGCLDIEVTAEDEACVDQLVPSGEHSGVGFQDVLYPVTGRQTSE
jgi:aryl-alcohol dehydrogenase-like predicted oxidoreductase